MACANRDANSVSIIDIATKKTTHILPIGLHPEEVTFLGASHDVAVAVYGDDLIRIVSAETGETIRSIEVFDEPYSVVASKDGEDDLCHARLPGEGPGDRRRFGEDRAGDGPPASSSAAWPWGRMGRGST